MEVCTYSRREACHAMLMTNTIREGRNIRFSKGSTGSPTITHLLEINLPPLARNSADAVPCNSFLCCFCLFVCLIVSVTVDRFVVFKRLPYRLGGDFFPAGHLKFLHLEESQPRCICATQPTSQYSYQL